MPKLEANRRKVRLVAYAAVLGALAGLAEASAQELLPDIVPWVREDAPYLVNWDILNGTLRVQTMFANIGDGLFQIRTDLAGTGGPTTPVTQRVFQGIDNGLNYTDYYVEEAVNFHQAHGHIHFENFSEFELLQAVIDPSGTISVGPPVAETVKSSYHISDSTRIPDPQYANRVSYPSSNTGLYQNISVGWGDVYSQGTDGQSISLVGVPVGPLYWLRQTVDPNHVVREKDYTNNSIEILIDLTHPGEAIRHFDNSFVRPGDISPPVPGDLTGDRVVDIQDWLALKAAASASLTGLDDLSAWLLGDFNLDGQHTLSDVLLFRQYYDDAVGAGAFDAIAGVPEPATIVLAVAGLGLTLMVRRRHSFRVRRGVLRAAAFSTLVSILTVRYAAADTTLFSENFDEVALGPNVDETVANPHAWTHTPPAGWTINNSGVPYLNDSTRGVTEWKGWSLADKAWWVNIAGDQNRSQFALGQGTIAVADPDEWDDKGDPLNPFVGYYGTFFSTPAVSLAGASPGAARLMFSSSWRSECCDDGPSHTNDQTATVRVSYDGGASFSEVMRWDSNPSSAKFKPNATNETVKLDLNNPPSAANVVVQFGLSNAGNDWWWGIDNVKIFTPTILEVNVQTGQMSIVGATQMTGYEITSAAGSLNHAGWQAGNLDAQDLGSTPPLTADFNNDNTADGADFLAWQRGQGLAGAASHASGDADGDHSVNSSDLAAWRQQFGQSVAPGHSWETIIATDKRLLEFALSASTTAATLNVGQAFNTLASARDIAFRYTSLDGVETPGIVRYVTGSGASIAPEPTASLIFLSGLYALAWRRRHPTD